MHTHNWLTWRYATKKFDTSKELSPELIDQILTAGNLAATSYGLQPFKIVVVTDPQKKAALVPPAYNQAHVGENGALLILAARTDVDEAMVAEYIARIATIRNIPESALENFKGMMTGDLTARTPEARLVWAQKQAYIALGTMMVAASELGVDNCPMEGFNPDAVDAALDLPALHLRATAFLALGYRSADDRTQQYAKVRRDLTDLVVRI